MGVEATLHGEKVLVGNLGLMKKHGIQYDEISDLNNSEIEEMNLKEEQGSAGMTKVFIAHAGKLLGVLNIADDVKESSGKAIAELKKKNIKVYMITGDQESAAMAVAKRVGIDHVFAGVLPEEKAHYIEQLQQEGEHVMMVGDGINDAPALIQADVGCAIGNGSDIALESGDIVLMKSDLMDVSKAITLSSKTIRNVKQNLFWAFCYNTIGIPIACGVLYPMAEKLLDPQFAGLAMALSSVCVVGNALRLRYAKLED